ncbi:hypothetical protein K2Z84_13505 [Candidatus Binatia bacterium]|nr:hypothetical protein [Candidatus Binatia bacterium]
MDRGRQLVVTAAVVAAALVAQRAGAQELPGPTKAKQYMASFVQAFSTCGSPNDTTTGAISLPACHPAIPVDTGCTFGPGGRGTGSAVVLPADGVNPQDIRIRGRLIGLSPGCEGETLCVSATLVVSTVGCTSDDPAGCTMSTLTDFPIGTMGNGCGVVQDGKVKLRTTVNTAFNAEVLNSNTVIQVRGVGVRRTTSVNSMAPSASSFESGFLTR